MNKKNLANGTVQSVSNNEITLQSGEGALFPTAPFYVTASPAGSLANSLNSEIMRVEGVTGDVLNVVRAQRGTTQQSVGEGWLIGNGVYAEDVDAKADATGLTNSLPETVGASGKVLKSNGSAVTWQDDTNTTYSEISEAEINTGTASTARTISGRRAKKIIDNAVASVDKNTVGLGNVDNTSDMDKPVSVAVQNAIDNASQESMVSVSDMEFPAYLSHRGGALIYPEMSTKAFEETARAGFLLECDIRKLSDGTLVLLHDATVDRTMSGVSGAANSLTKNQFMSGRVKPAIRNGRYGTPATFEWLLDKFGGKNILAPEIKDYGAAQDVIGMVKDRGLEDSVILQCFDFSVASQVAQAGIHSCYLYSSTSPHSPSQIYNAGIRYVGRGKDTVANDAAALKAAGLKVFAYTVNKKDESDNLINNVGVDGVFSDDPWYLTGNYDIEGSPSFIDGYGKPGTTTVQQTVVSRKVNNISLSIAGNGVQFESNTGDGGINNMYLPSLGPISVPFRIGMTVEFIDSNPLNDTASVGFALYKNTVDPNELWWDGATPGQEGFTAAIRRNGQVAAWKFVSGAAAQSVTSTPAKTGSGMAAPTGMPGGGRFYAEVTGTKVRLLDVSGKVIAEADDTFNQTNMTFLLRSVNYQVGWGKAVIRDVSVERL